MKKVKEKMIKNLHIENFQSHKDTGIQFQPGVNVIIGGSDKGKSAIIRALNWVCNNKPIGNAFMSNWGGETIVTLDKVKRRRTKSKNEYYLAPIETPLLAFKNDPPLEILNYFNMGDINWQHQHDSSFLLSSSDGEVARMLNKTVDLTIIDTSHANINKAITAANTDKKYCEANIKDIEIKLEDFDEVEAMQKAVKKVKRKTGYKSKKQKDAMSINSSILKIIEARAKGKKFDEIISLESNIIKLEAKEKKQDQLDNKFIALNDLVNTLLRIKGKRSEIVSISVKKSDLDSIAIKIDNRAEKQLKKQNMKRSIVNLRRIITERQDLVILIQGLEDNMPEECPACGGKL